MTSELARAWRDARAPAATVHLDTAACGRTTTAVQAAVAAHLAHESEVGGYRAEVAAEPALDAARGAVGALLGFAADDVVFTESGTSAMAALLRSWPAPAGSRVALLDSEWGPNLAALEDQGWHAEALTVDADGVLDLEALEVRLRGDPPDLLHLTHVSSHQGLVQPVAAAAEVAAAAGVPLVVDAAQALGHVDAVSTAAATYATSRKWLGGPRGVGLLAVRPDAAARLTAHAPQVIAPMAAASLPRLRRWESAEGNIAGRVGLAVALTEHLAAGPTAVYAELRAVGRRTRLALADLPGWRVVEPLDASCAITTLTPTGDISVADAHARLGAEGFVTTLAMPARAPRAMTAPRLRLSPHVDVTDDELRALARVLVGAAR